MARLANDGLKELCDKYPDQFAGFVAEVPLTAPDAGARECERAIKELGACGVQIVTNVNGKPLDRPEFEPFFARMNAARRCRCGCIRPAPPQTPDYADEKKSLYEIWWTFGWSYETAAFMARMVFSKTLDKYPDLKIIVHHFGGIVPMLEGRIGPGWDQIGARTSDEDYQALRKSLKKRPLDYFKQDFYADTAVFGGDGATIAGKMFYPLEKIVFASDCPFDPEKGTMYIRETIAADREDGLDQGGARAGVLQEPGADHREEVREVARPRRPLESAAAAKRGRKLGESPSRFGHGRLRRSSGRAATSQEPAMRLVITLLLASPRLPRPRPARRPGAARRQDHHGRQGLARRAGGRDPRRALRCDRRR